MAALLLPALCPALTSGVPAGEAGGEAAALTTVALLAGDVMTVTVEAARIGGPGASPAGASQYVVTAEDIGNLPSGDAATMTDVLAHMPGVAIDQNQQIHIRNTEGPQFQYQINGVLIPLDINTNPPFLSMINPLFIKQVDLLDGVLPARYSYATGGVVDITTKNGCDEQGGEASVVAGQRDTLQPSVEYAGCRGQLGSYVNARYASGNDAFSSATPGPNPLHDRTRQGQAFGFFSYPLAPTAKLSLLLSAARSENELPNVPDLAPQFALAGVPVAPPSAGIDSSLNFTDYLAVLALSGTAGEQLHYQLAYSEHSLSQRFVPDPVGELMYQGVASTASHDDRDHTLEGDLTYAVGPHTLATGFYAGDYTVHVHDSSLVFAADAAGAQLRDVPLTIGNSASANNVVLGAYASDLWQISPRLRVSAGLRFDALRGFTRDEQLDPTLSLAYLPSAATTLHVGYARYFQVPSFLGISPTAQAAFAGTTAAGPPGIATPLTEDDREWDAGIVQQVSSRLSVSADAYYEWTHRYLDTGQFGVVPIFAPFNYDRGHLWGSELAAKYKGERLSAYANLTVGRNWQQGVATGQFNFPADELAYIDSHAIVLDHQPLVGASAGATYRAPPYSISVDALYSSGLRAGFADLEPLPHVVQVNLSVERTFHVPGLGPLTNRITVLNVFDRVNLIRPAEGIGIFQSAYGPRITVLDTLAVSF